MSNIELGYLHIPTNVREFIYQTVDHLETETGLNSDLRTLSSNVLSRKKVSISEYVTIFRALDNYLDDEMLGFLPRKVPVGSFAALCQMLYHSPDILTALENYKRFSFDAMPFDEEFSYLYGVITKFRSDTTSLLNSKAVLEYPVQSSKGAGIFGDHYIENLLLWSTKYDLARNV